MKWRRFARFTSAFLKNSWVGLLAGSVRWMPECAGIQEV